MSRYFGTGKRNARGKVVFYSVHRHCRRKGLQCSYHYHHQQKKDNITSLFSRTYTIENGTKLTDVKPVTWQDATTGTTLLERYGSVNIGSKTGTVTVKIAFTPIGAYTDKYNSLTASYTITIQAPQNVTQTLTHNGSTIEDNTTLNISTGKDTYGNALSGFTALPELKLTYEQNEDVNDITQYYDISYALSQDGGATSLLTRQTRKSHLKQIQTPRPRSR